MSSLTIKQSPQIYSPSHVEKTSSDELVKNLIVLKLIESSKGECVNILSQQHSAVVPSKGLDPNSQQQNTLNP